MTTRDGIARLVSDRTGRTSYRARASWLDAEGRRVHRSRSFRTRKEAERWRRDVLATVARGEWFEAAPLPVSDVADRWLESVERSRAASTYRQYRHTWRNHVNPRIGSRPVGSVTATQLQTWYDELARAYAPQTVAMVHKVVRGIFGHAVTDGLIRANPADGRRLPTDDPAPPQAWTPDEARRFLRYAENDDDAILYAVMLATGLRVGEALALKWDVVDLDARTLRVERTLQSTVDGWRIAETTKTKASRRPVALPAAAVLALRRQRALVDGELVFPAWHGGAMVPSTCRDRLMRLCVAAGVPLITPQVLRSTAVSLMLAAGVPLKVAAEQTRHSVEMLLKRYAAVSVDMQRQAADALDTVLDTGRETGEASDPRHMRRSRPN